MKKIKLTKNQFSIIDDGLFQYLNKFKWSCQKGIKYAGRRLDNKIVLLHRLIINAPKGLEVDHINGNGLDNRIENLRICTASENRKNHKLLKTNKSGFNGVSWSKQENKWVVCISLKNKTFHAGSFLDKNEAAKKYNELAKKHYGNFARLNIIGGQI